jgi:hypothetical protein
MGSWIGSFERLNPSLDRIPVELAGEVPKVQGIRDITPLQIRAG